MVVWQCRKCGAVLLKSDRQRHFDLCPVPGGTIEESFEARRVLPGRGGRRRPVDASRVFVCGWCGEVVRSALPHKTCHGGGWIAYRLSPELPEA